MVSTNANALGILFPNSYDDLVPELTKDRLMASIPFASRYRMIDFILSDMVSGGIDNITAVVKSNYLSLLDHLGSGREWDLTRKNGGLNIVPPYSQKQVSVYRGRINALASILIFLKRQKEEYVVMADANVALNFDFADFLKQHIASGADVTVAYKKRELPVVPADKIVDENALFYSLTLDADGKRVKKVMINPKAKGEQNLGLNIYAMGRQFLIEQVEAAYMRGLSYFERDILAPKCGRLNIQGYEYKGYSAHIGSFKDYYDESMKLLTRKNLNGLFSGNEIHTKIRDDNPTRYIPGATVKNVLCADGCVIEGEVKDCVIFRGVKVEKGAKVRNCVLMQDTVVKAGADLRYAVTDKNVTITEGQTVKGTESFPVFIPKNATV